MQARTLISQFFPYRLLRKISRSRLAMPLYHLVSNQTPPHVRHLHIVKSEHEFISELDFFLKEHSPIGLQDLIDYIINGRQLPEHALFLSFDDGYRECFDIIRPILLKKGIPATFFLTTDFLDNKKLGYKCKQSVLKESYLMLSGDKEINLLLSSIGLNSGDFSKAVDALEYHHQDKIDELAEILGIDFNGYLAQSKPYLDSTQVEQMLEEGFTIGAHSEDHPVFENISINEQIRQTENSIKFLEERFKIKYRTFAFPFYDNGVGRKFFDEASSRHLFDISFGTAGLMDDDIPNNLQRVWMEATSQTAKNIFKEKYLTKFVKLQIHKNIIHRL
ncbi:MAG: hypothetical protein HW421_1511 [Ignavibacteria bacterium]|nr:hypothetical protein [Ignavibacteria bacterium]